MVCIGPPFIATDKEVSEIVRRRVKNTHQPVFGHIELARQAIGPHLVRLKNRAHLIILLLRDRIEHMIVALGATNREPEESLGCMLNRIFEPLLPAEHFIIANQKTGRAKSICILRSQLVGREHLQHHSIIAFIVVERLDNPITPAPDMRFAVANLVTVAPARPIAITPDIHPVPGPTLSVARIF